MQTETPPPAPTSPQEQQGLSALPALATGGRQRRFTTRAWYRPLQTGGGSMLTGSLNAAKIITRDATIVDGRSVHGAAFSGRVQPSRASTK